eukprot:CAMPEP_0184717986 /NCGR_PEP_ID=MMETSP0314-20130426/7297_1 /TAXON_ID=38298 /ORGANISM="Rhodella maculata, Strain CCMP 736" /LENGTH=439 /DNA_ID=CAMNT_0027181647 /DNA_START=51 /DNA_END=1370 /DNA_ORIENTATION=-
MAELAGLPDALSDNRAYPLPGESAADFASRVRPSQTTTSDVSWVQINCPPDKPGVKRSDDSKYGSSTAMVRAIIQEYKEANIMGAPAGHRIKAQGKSECFKRIYEAAISCGDTCGKWMLFVKPEEADGVWTKIAVGVEQGKLGHSAKVSPFSGEAHILHDRGVLICVYVSDFSDLEECERVLRGIKDLGLYVRCAFKADALTSAGLESGTLAPLKLTESWQLHLDILHKIYPPKDGKAPKKKGFDWGLLGATPKQSKTRKVDLVRPSDPVAPEKATTQQLDVVHSRGSTEKSTTREVDVDRPTASVTPKKSPTREVDVVLPQGSTEKSTTREVGLDRSSAAVTPKEFTTPEVDVVLPPDLTKKSTSREVDVDRPSGSSKEPTTRDGDVVCLSGSPKQSKSRDDDVMRPIGPLKVVKKTPHPSKKRSEAVFKELDEDADW